MVIAIKIEHGPQFMNGFSEEFREPHHYFSGYSHSLTGVQKSNHRHSRTTNIRISTMNHCTPKHRVKSPSAYTEKSIQWQKDNEHYLSVLEALNKMRPQIRSSFLLNRYEGYTYSQIAESFNISTTLVEQQIFTALCVVKETVSIQ